MLFLLRKIRRKLISTENKVLSYLIYAIGEVILVVVGILIAVQIDDWNKLQQRKKLEIQSLEQVKESMNIAIDQLDEVCLAFNTMRRELAIAAKVLENHKEFPDSMGHYLTNLLLFPTPKFNMSAYDNLKRHGTDLIRRKELREEILHTYENDFYYMIHELDQLLRDFRNLTARPHIMNYLRIDAVMPLDELKKMRPDFRLINVSALKNDEVLLNIIYQYHGETTFGMMEAQKLTFQSKQVIAHIDAELNRLKK